MNRKTKTMVLLAFDLSGIVIAGLLALLVRFDFTVPSSFLQTYLSKLPLLLLVRITIYFGFGLYRHLWQYASVRELLTIVLAASIASGADWLMLIKVSGNGFSRSVVLAMWAFNLLYAGGIRFLVRLRREWHLSRMSNKGVTVQSLDRPRTRILIIGAGEAGTIVAKELRTHAELAFQPVGFVDDDPRKQGYKIAGLPVLGTRKDLPRIVEQQAVNEIVIAMPSAPGTIVKEIVETCRELPVVLKTLPGVYELIDGKASVNHIRHVQIEDLLRRKEVRIDLRSIAGYLTDKRVFVTGAGGSIGSELCRQIARFDPAGLILLGHGENSIYEIEMELRNARPGLKLFPVIADIRDQHKIDIVFDRFRPNVVFHAAAHKHVPLMESNPDEAITNNIFGTWNVAQAADRFKCSRFVLISTDKAVNPVSVMGCSKRVGEIIIQTLNRISQTKFVAVRFGNVLGSRGSVIPLFKKQIARGGPVTLTHPDMKRYFMTIPEAIQLVIQAGAMGKGGEVFVLDMGEPVRILDMARDLIRLSGLEPDKDIRIEFIGTRPGEKLFEELLTAEEGTVSTKHERIFVARGEPSINGSMNEFLEACKAIAASGDECAGVAFTGLVTKMIQTSGDQRKREVAASNMTAS